MLGEGAEGVVSRARDRRSGKEVALKWIRGDGPDGHGPPDRRALAMEAGCLRACRGHPSIIGIDGVAADPKTGDVHLVLELIEGGLSLRDSDYMWRTLSEDAIRGMMRQLFGAAKKVHSLGFIHRDIKSENILVCPLGELKLCDFGSATRKKPDGKPHQACPVGTLQYNAPELLDGNWYYGPAVDMWGLGCVMAELLSGERLFQAESEYEMTAEMSELRDRMTSAAGKLDLECLKDLSEDGRDVLTGLLAFCPEKRLTAVEALEHRWLTTPRQPWIDDFA
jgi:cell division cycle 2-like protein